MDEFIKMLIERLEENAKLYRENENFMRLNPLYQKGLYGFKALGYEDSIRIVTQLAEEYNNGWIPCSERLPELNEELFSDDMLVSFDDSNNLKIAFYDGNKKSWYLRSSAPYIGKVIAWQPLPAPYKPTKEQPDSISEA